METEDINIAKKLTSLRKKSGLSQSEVSNLSKIAVPLISKYESGIIEPPARQLKKLAKVYKIEMYQFYTDQIKEGGDWKKRCEQLLEEIKLLRKTNDDLYNELFKK